MFSFARKMLHRIVGRSRDLGMERCNEWAAKAVGDLAPDSLLDVGCGNGEFLFRYLGKVPHDFCGVEGAPDLAREAQKRGIQVSGFDLNGRWPYEDNRFDVVFSSQVIEHLHNCRLFVQEAYRVLKPGGTVVVTSENLCSLLNCFALCLGYTPFSLMQTCGRYLGNPLGMHSDEVLAEPLPLDHPAFSGVSGHVRVLTVRQARDLFNWCKFESIEARSIGILPLPDSVSRVMEGFVRNRGHFLMVRARKSLRAR